MDRGWVGWGGGVRGPCLASIPPTEEPSDLLTVYSSGVSLGSVVPDSSPVPPWVAERLRTVGDGLVSVPEGPSSVARLGYKTSVRTTLPRRSSDVGGTAGVALGPDILVFEDPVVFDPEEQEVVVQGVVRAFLESGRSVSVPGLDVRPDLCPSSLSHLRLRVSAAGLRAGRLRIGARRPR